MAYKSFKRNPILTIGVFLNVFILSLLAPLCNDAAVTIGPEFQVNTYTHDYQGFPSVAGLSGGGFVVTRQSFGQDGSSMGIYGQLFEIKGKAMPWIPLLLLDEDGNDSVRLTPPEQEFVLRFARDRVALAPLDPALNLGNEFTIEAWIFPEQELNSVIIGKMIGDENFSCPSYLIQTVENASKLEFVQTAGNCDTLTSVVSTESLEMRSWTHVAATLGNGTMKLYVNGVEMGSATSPGTPLNGDNPLAIGSAYNTSSCWDGFPGAIAQVRVWNRTLTATEIVNNAGIYLNGNESGLVVYWPLDDGKGLQYRDISNNNLALMGQADLFNWAFNLGPHWAITDILNNSPYFALSSVYPSIEITNGELIDFDNDGDLDFIAIINQGGNTPKPILVYSNDGLGNFYDTTTAVLGEAPVNIINPCEQAVADFNNDGLMDYFIADGGPEYHWGCPGGQSRILIQSSEGNLMDETNTRLPLQEVMTHHTTVGDIDGDNDIDIFMCNHAHATPSQLYGNNGAGQFAILLDHLPYADYLHHAASSLLVDIEKDGDLDLVLCSPVDTIYYERDRVLLNNGKGYFTPADVNTLPPRYGGEDSANFDIEAEDFDGDGWPDLMTAPLNHSELNFPYIQLAINNRDGTFSDAPHAVPMDFPDREEDAWFDNIYVFDINRDGWMDFSVRGAGYYMESFIYLNIGNAQFIEANEILPHWEGGFIANHAIRPGDIDNDGDIDFLILIGQTIFIVAKNIKQLNIGTTPLLPPGIPSLISPINERTVSKSPKLSWNENGPTTSNQLQVSTDANFSNIINSKSAITADNYTVDLNDIQTFFWRVRGTNTGGTGEWSESWSFTTENYPPTSIELSSNSIVEYSSIGTLVGQLITTDPDGGDTHTYSFSIGDGINDVDNESYVIDGDILKTNVEIDYATKSSYNIYIKTEDGFGGTFAQAFIIEVIPYGLVAHYPFDGNANDESGNGNHGTVHGPVLTTDRFDSENSAYSFDGINDNIDLGTGLGLVNNTDQLTIAAWIYPYETSPNGTNRQYTILGERSGGDNYQFAVVDNYLYFSFWSDGNELMFWGNEEKIEMYKWHFVTVTYDGASVKLYINEGLDTYFGASGNIDGHDSTLFIGSWNGTHGMFNGKIDDLMIFNRALSDEEITNLFEEGVQSQ